MLNKKELWQIININININMGFEDNKNAIYCDPNAYILNYKCETKTRKVVFQEPYECLPPFHINNNFKKHNCKCVCGNGNKSNQNCKKEEKNKNYNSKSNVPFSFDLKSLLPLLSLFSGTGNNTGLSDILSMIGNGCEDGKNNSSSLDFSKVISTFLNNGNGLNFLSGLIKRPQKKEHEMKSTDVPIKNYTRVE